jgi:hypothetical protein
MPEKFVDQSLIFERHVCLSAMNFMDRAESTFKQLLLSLAFDMASAVSFIPRLAQLFEDGVADGIDCIGWLDFPPRHRPDGFAAERDGPQDFANFRIPGIASHHVRALAGKAFRKNPSPIEASVV